MEEKELYKMLDMAESRLNDKQIAFCKNYLNCHNASEAYRNSGYSTKSAKAVRASASKLLSHPNVQEYLSISKQINEKYTRLTREDIIRKLEYLINSTETPRGELKEYIKLLTQMNGWSAPTKTETTINHVGDVGTIAERLANMTPEEKRAEFERMKNSELN